MSDRYAIQVEGLGKKYVIGHDAERERYVALRDVVGRAIKGTLRRTLDMIHGQAVVAGDTTEEFWALKDISFEVRRGEVLGIIGRNGAGKSTLLKILSRITDPTEGRVVIDGRVASLLEVGTGFHPELSGRENVFLNGAILGMTRAEIKRKFDEIVAFAGVERFIDTPVKRYSSGMYVRLAFAVAAHLEPEVLIVDEVLAVGDAEFQKKCLGKMGEVASGGRTILFVSHNLGVLQAICSTGILLDNGSLTAAGSMELVAQKYKSNTSSSEMSLGLFEGPLRGIRFENLVINGMRAQAFATVRPDHEIRISATGSARKDIAAFQFVISLYSGDTRILTFKEDPQTLPSGPFRFDLQIPANLLRPGTYSIAMGGRDVQAGDWIWARHAIELEIVEEWQDAFSKYESGLITLQIPVKRYSGSAATTAQHEWSFAKDAISE